jgi:hypothetical protein
MEKGRLLRTWRLTRSARIGEDGAVTYPWGESPIGFVTYTADFMSLQIMSADRRPLTSVESSFVSYAGTYTVVGDTVFHHVHASSRSDWLGITLVRRAAFEGEALTLSSVNGRPSWINEWAPFTPR